MTVKELKRKLEKYDDNIEIVIFDQQCDPVQSTKLIDYDYYYAGMKDIKEKCILIE